MAEIRNLTRNGETFYPLTTSSAVINESTGEGLVIDETPTAGSNNLVKSGGVVSSGFVQKTDIDWANSYEGYITESGIVIQGAYIWSSNNVLMKYEIDNIDLSQSKYIFAKLAIQSNTSGYNFQAMAFYNGTTLISTVPFPAFDGNVHDIASVIPENTTVIYLFNRLPIQATPILYFKYYSTNDIPQLYKEGIIQNVYTFPIEILNLKGIGTDWVKKSVKFSDLGLQAGDKIYVGVRGENVSTNKIDKNYFFLVFSSVPEPWSDNQIKNIVQQYPYTKEWEDVYVPIIVPNDWEYLSIGIYCNVDSSINFIVSSIDKYTTKTKLNKEICRYDRISKLSYIVNKQARYILNSYIPTRFPDLSNIDFNIGSMPEFAVRTPANAICSLAKLIVSGLYDTNITYYSKELAIENIKAIANALVDCYDDWRHCWETAMWMHQLATAMFLLEDYFTTGEMDALRTIVLAEADYLLTKEQGSGFDDVGTAETYTFYDALWGEQLGNNTQLESVNFWNKIFAIAVLKYNDAANYEQYKQKMVEFSVMASSCPEDQNSEEVINGYNLGEMLGYNITNEGFAFNGTGILQPDYMTFICELIAKTGSVYSFFNARLPIACQHNIERYINAIIDYEFKQGETVHGTAVIAPYGKILKPTYDKAYYPQGNYWGTERSYMLCPSLFALYSCGYNAKLDFTRYADQLLDRVLYLIERFNDGHIVASSSENNYGNGGYPAEMDAADTLSSCLFNLLYPSKFTTDNWFE